MTKKPVADNTAKKLRGKPFQPGENWSGNAAGRPKGARSRLTEDFLTAVADDFEQHGRAALTKVREEDPSTYVKVVAQIIPKEAELNIKGGEIFEKIWRLIGEDADAALEQGEGSDADAVH